MTITIPPSQRSYKRARTWNMFCSLFAPIRQTNGNYLIEPWDVPKDAEHTHWWSIVDLNPNGRRFYLQPGIDRTNRIGLVRCERAWGGEAEAHPDYLYL